MFKDTEEELKRLEAELLEDENDTDNMEDMDAEDDDLLEEIIREVKSEEGEDMDATRRIYTPEQMEAVRQGYNSSDMDATRRVYAPEDLNSARKVPVSRDSGNTPKVYNSDRIDGDLQSYCDELEEKPGRGSITGLVVTAAVLSAGILAVLIWWIVRYWGAL